ncbi:MAG: EthD family reductase [Clostridia bacterium]
MSKPVKLISLLKAKPGVGKEEFKRHWLEEHSPLIMKFKNLKGYRINIAIEEYQEIEGELPYDGTAELWWDSIEEMKGDFASSAADEALADADSFMQKINIYSEEYIIKHITAEI